jgi:hypothetical protein
MTYYIVKPVEWNTFKRKWRRIGKTVVVNIDGKGDMSKFAEAFFCYEKHGVTPFGRDHMVLMNKAFDKEPPELKIIYKGGKQDFKGIKQDDSEAFIKRKIK